MANSAPPSLPPLLDNPFADEFFADEATGFYVHQGNISITFSSARVDHRSNPGPVSRVVVGRVVLPITAAAGLAVGLYDFLRQMGIDPAGPVPNQSAQGNAVAAQSVFCARAPDGRLCQGRPVEHGDKLWKRLRDAFGAPLALAGWPKKCR
jgi:hypothetical protein